MEGSQLLVVSRAVAVVGLVEECMVSLGQRYSKNEVVVVVVAVVKDSTI